MNIKKTLAIVGSGLLSLPTLLAQEGSSSLTVDLSKAEEAADTLGTAISDLLSGKVMTNLFVILGAALAIAAVFMVVRWFLRGSKAASK